MFSLGPNNLKYTIMSSLELLVLAATRLLKGPRDQHSAFALMPIREDYVKVFTGTISCQVKL